MIRRPLFRKAFHGLLSVLYLSLSLYAVTCSLHHDPLTDLHSDRHDSSHHSHEAGGKSPQNSSPDNGLFCKFVQKIGGSAVILHASVSPSLDEIFHPFSDYDAIPSESVSGTNFSRGPPSA